MPDFGTVLPVLRQGGRVTRAGWNGAGQWIALQEPDENSKMTRPYLYIKTVQGDVVPWLASQTDMLATDWMIADGATPPALGASPRVFLGYRPRPPEEYLAKGISNAGVEPDYEGVVFTDGTVVLRWQTEYQSTSVWACWQDMWHVHGHPEYGTVIRFEDGGPPPGVPDVYRQEVITDGPVCQGYWDGLSNEDPTA